MRALLGASRHDSGVIFVAGALALLSVGVLSGHGVKVLAPLMAIVSIVAASQLTVIGWHRLIALIVLVVMFVPIGRYKLPGSLPFDLELYRVVVAICLLLWIASLLVDSRVRLASTPFDPPLLLILACVLGSEVTNPSRVGTLASHVVKSVTFFGSFVLVYYLTAITIRRRADADFLLKLLTLSGAAIGIFAIYEQRSHYNVFDHLHSVLPFLTFEGPSGYLMLGGNLRVYGPSQQPIALGAALVVILPFAVYFAKGSGRRWWWLVAVLLLLGAFASGSRTAMVMLAVEGIVFLCLKPAETMKLWPALIPALAAVHVALPGTIGSLKDAFFPKGGLIAQQSKFQADYNPLLAGGRIRLIKPMLSEASRKPVFGEGYGTRITGFDTPDRNAPILDDQWLNNVLDVGFVGLAAWVWLMARACRKLFGASRTAEEVRDGWLFAALGASVASFAVGMLTFDAFSFTQATFIFWIVLGLSAALLKISTRPLASGAQGFGHRPPTWQP
jgi:hypothetical protein